MQRAFQRIPHEIWDIVDFSGLLLDSGKAAFESSCWSGLRRRYWALGSRRPQSWEAMRPGRPYLVLFPLWQVCAWQSLGVAYGLHFPRCHSLPDPWPCSCWPVRWSAWISVESNSRWDVGGRQVREVAAVLALHDHVLWIQWWCSRIATPNQCPNLIVPISKGQGTVKLRAGDLQIVAFTDIQFRGIFISSVRTVLSVLMILVQSVARCESSHTFLHFLFHDISETSAAQMVTPCHLQTTQENSENHEEDEHCPVSSLMYFYEMEPTAFRVRNEVLGPLLVGYFLNVLAVGWLAWTRSWLPVVLAGACWEEPRLEINHSMPRWSCRRVARRRGCSVGELVWVQLECPSVWHPQNISKCLVDLPDSVCHSSKRCTYILKVLECVGWDQVDSPKLQMLLMVEACEASLLRSELKMNGLVAWWVLLVWME